jgi:DNA-binding NtrC family response regulator
MLDDRTILIVDDEAIIALDLAMMVEDRGAVVMGPAGSVRQAEELVEREAVDGAILDVDLRDHDVFPLADRLAAQRTPFVFHTGRSDRATLRARYGDVPIVDKPGSEAHLISALERALRIAA